jgi:uncharacterized protein YndB with AHSA1/START domain
MAHITQDIRIEAGRDEVFRALTTQQGYAAWWTKNCEVGEDQVELVFEGGQIKACFRFDERSPDNVRLTCVSNHNNPEWQDTTLRFALSEDGGATHLRFAHDRWKKNGTTVYNKCVGGWEYFLGSLKAYVETGKGTPHDR